LTLIAGVNRTKQNLFEHGIKNLLNSTYTMIRIKWSSTA